MRRVLVAQRINRTLGGAFVGPWDVDDLDDGTIEAILSVGSDLETLRRAHRQIENAFERARKRHPTYRKVR